MKNNHFENENYYNDSDPNSLNNDLYANNLIISNKKTKIRENPESDNEEDLEAHRLQISKDQFESEDEERVEMENDYQLVKSLNTLQEQNKKLQSLSKYQKSQIESLETELEKVLTENKLKELELEEYRSKNSNNPMSPEYKKQLNQMNQINNLNVKLDKYKSMHDEKKNEMNGLLEKYNELQKIVDKYVINEKKIKQETINKDKQIARLIEEMEKKNTISNSTKNTNKEKEEKEIERLTNEVKKLEKQKNELYIAFKKSIKLCSILKRQKVHLENARLLAFTEEEFKQLLEKEK